MNKDNRTVNHVTTVILQLLDDPIPYTILDEAKEMDASGVRLFGYHIQQRLERVAEMIELLAARGFVFHRRKNFIYGESELVEAQEAKRYLISKGYQDREFQISLEYIRKWGMM